MYLLARERERAGRSVDLSLESENAPDVPWTSRSEARTRRMFRGPLARKRERAGRSVDLSLESENAPDVPGSPRPWAAGTQGWTASDMSIQRQQSALLKKLLTHLLRHISLDC